MFAFHNSNASENSTESYLHDLQLYKYYPDGNFPLKELETISIQRIQVLQYVSKIYTETRSRRTALRCKTHLISTLKRDGYDLFARIINGASKKLQSDTEVVHDVLQIRRQDHISHFMLRAAFALHDESRWFYVQELRLFYWRLYTSTIEEMKEFLHINELKTYDISKEDEEELKEYIKASNLHDEMLFYKVPFTLVIDLVEKCKVFLRHGMAFVPEKELAGLCLGHFKENLASGLAYMPIVTLDAANDPRMDKIFHTLTEVLQKTLNPKVNGPSLAELDALSKTCYPLCMRLIHETLRKDHHISYGARLQYSLFLKSIGVTLDDALELWKQEFTKTIDDETFEKEHGYRLRHIYGEEGSQKEYQCYKCLSIMYSDIKPWDSHGCPFKHITKEFLREKLNEYKFVPDDIENIMIPSSMGNYQVACARYYQAANNSKAYKVFYSPVSYFNDSHKMLQHRNRTRTY